jgi:hypothetical protein
MRPLIFALLLALFAGAGYCSAAADSDDSVLKAIKQLPRAEAKKIARIEARDGKPLPERWHILVNDPKDENGLHEYVVAGGEIVASRNISQFAESLKPTDVIGASGVRVDADKLSNLAQQYAQANNMTVATLNYTLSKDGADAAPLWTVTCLDESGKQLGQLVVQAAKGGVISHEGFTADPGANGDKLDTESTAENDDDGKPRHHHKPVTHKNTQPDQNNPNFFGRVGNSLSKFFNGH